jgi:hypothetical protein
MGVRMKRLIASILLIGLMPIAAMPASADEDTRVFQYSKLDKSTPKGMDPNFDITEIQMGLSVEDGVEIYASVKGVAEAANVSEFSYMEVFIDNNLDKKPDYSIKQAPFEDTGYKITGQMIKISDGTVVTKPDEYGEETCEVYYWDTPDNDAFGFEFSKTCIALKSDVNIAIRSTADGENFDRFPDGSSWQKFKTQYMKAAACNSNEKNVKRTYDGTTWICMKSGSKWSWKDYAPIAAKNAKYLTEKAYYSCKINGKIGVSLEDGGKTLTLDGAFLYFITEKDYNCVAKVLGMPSSVDRRISITRALDGMQETSWGRINAFWNYHPDSGLNITFSYN